MLSRWRLLGGAFVLLGAGGCQAVLGDFEVDDVKSVPVVLGDACEPDAVRCSGARLEGCAPDRRGWALIADCTSPDQCDPEAVACRPCTPGMYACNGATLEACDAGGAWRQQGDPCVSPELCHVSADRTSGECLAPKCDQAGLHRCDGNRLLRCSSGRDMLTLVERCGSAELCDAARADAQVAQGGRGACVPARCALGSYACDGATLERCRDDQTDWQPVTTCADAPSCNPAAGSCSPCQAGDVVCSGSNLLRCGAAGFELVATCTSPASCDPAGGQCLPVECQTPGAVRCVTGDLTAIEECGSDGRWLQREACDTAALCSESAGRCLAPACDRGDARCLGQQHQVCADDLTRWVTDVTCSTAQTCTAGGCDQAACSDGAYRCNAASLERCAAGRWLPEARCASAALCDATAQKCKEPACGGALGEFECKGQILRRCADGRDTWTDLLTCTGSRAVCDPDPVTGSNLPTCDACQPLAYACSGNELHRCTADGSALPLLAVCPGGCSLSAGTPSCSP